MKLFFMLLLAAMHAALYAQDTNKDLENKEGFRKLPKNIIRREISTFSTFAIDEKDPAIKLNSIPLKQGDGYFMSFIKDDITVTIKSKFFDASKYKLHYNGSDLVRINNKPFYGTNGRIPREAIQSVEVIVDADTIRLPQDAYADVFEPRMALPNENSNETNYPTEVYTSPDKRRIYILMMSGDGAGAYEVTWIIENKKYLRRVLDYGY